MKRFGKGVLLVLAAIFLAAPLLILAAAYFVVPIAYTLLQLLDFLYAVIDLDPLAILKELGILLLIGGVTAGMVYLPFYLRWRFDDHLRRHPDQQSRIAHLTSRKETKRIIKYTTYFLLSVFSIVFLFPMVWMLATSTKPDILTYQQMGTIESFLPSFEAGINWLEGYVSVWRDFHIWKYGLNSVVYAIVIVTGNLFVNSMAGYALAKYDFPGKRLIFTVVIGLIIIPIETTIIPLYTIVHSLGLTGTVFAILIPPLVSVFNIFLFRQFFVSIPKELEEAALLDGASRFRIYYSIILPLSKPILATVATFTFIGVWNDYVWPLMVLPPPSGDTWPLYPIQAALNTIQQHPTITTREVMASLTLTTIPLIIVYVAAQKYIVEGLGHTGLK